MHVVANTEFAAELTRKPADAGSSNAYSANSQTHV